MGPCLSWLVGLLLLSLPALASVPPKAKAYLPALVAYQRQLWPAAPFPSFLAGQIEQETCISMTHSKCWSPRAELKTKRENGIGLGQATRAYNADGSVKFDTIGDLRRLHPELSGWSWKQRYNAAYQLKGLILMDRDLWHRVKAAESDSERLAFTLSAYNGGMGGVLQDRRLCANTPGCNPNRWKGHVERTSLKARKATSGYGKSFFEINREYVSNILEVRRQKYSPYFEQETNGR